MNGSSSFRDILEREKKVGEEMEVERETGRGERSPSGGIVSALSILIPSFLQIAQQMKLCLEKKEKKKRNQGKIFAF